MIALDTSVLILRERDEEVGAWFRQRLLADELAVCDLVRLEYLFDARNGAHYGELREALGALHAIAIEPPDWARSLAIQHALAQQTGGGQRAVKIADLIIAASAERAGLELIHYDADYDRIASITGQPARWVAAP